MVDAQLIETLAEEGKEDGFVTISRLLEEMGAKGEIDEADVQEAVERLGEKGMEVVDDTPVCYTQCWTAKKWDEVEKDFADQPLAYTAGNDFIETGVEGGDVVYVLGVRKGQVHLCGCMQLADVVNKETATTLLEHPAWDATDHCLPTTATPMRFKRVVPSEVVAKLRFETPDGEVAIRLNKSGGVDEKAISGVRQLTAESALLLDEILDGEDLFEFDYEGEECGCNCDCDGETCDCDGNCDCGEDCERKKKA